MIYDAGKEQTGHKMFRNLFALLVYCVVCCGFAANVQAKGLQALAKILPEETEIADLLLGDLSVSLNLSQPIPHRVFSLSNPNRIVFDFREVDWAGFDPKATVTSKSVVSVRYGIFHPGWSRLVLELNQPMVIWQSELITDPAKGNGLLKVRMSKTSQEEFDAVSSAPAVAGWELPRFTSKITPKKRQLGDRPLVIVIDPGHGGIDVGAKADRFFEKDLVLKFALEMKEALIRTGRYEAKLTRDKDEFVSLQGRISRARSLNADLFISLHADALADGSANGTTIYTLSENASDSAAAMLATQLDRADLLSGVDLTHQDDQLAGVLMDMARLETDGRSDLLAEMMVQGIAQSIGQLRKRPHLSAGFSVLRAPDIPSILIELGFMTSRVDLRNLTTPEWRAKVIDGMILALDAWAVEDAAQAKLLRQ